MRARERQCAKAQTSTLVRGGYHVHSVRRNTATRPSIRAGLPICSQQQCRSPAARPSPLAADMPMHMPMKAPAAPAAPPYQWTGCYVGLNGGGGASASNFTTTVDRRQLSGCGRSGEVNNDGTGSANISNFLGGGQAGCNWQTGTVVVGLEGDFDYFHSNSNFFNNTNTLPTSGNTFVIGQSLTTNYLATVRPRIGVAADRNFGLRHRRRRIHRRELHGELRRQRRRHRHRNRLEIPHRLDRRRRLGICLDRPCDDQVRISVRGFPDDERDRR